MKKVLFGLIVSIFLIDCGGGSNSNDNNGNGNQATTPVEESKQLFQKLRTQATSVVDYNNSGNNGFLNTEADSMDKELNDVVINIDFIGNILARFIEKVSEAESKGETSVNNIILEEYYYYMDDYEPRIANLTKKENGYWEYEVLDNNGTKWTGYMNYPNTLTKNSLFKDFEDEFVVEINGDLPLDYEPVNENGIEDKQSFNIELNLDKKITSKVINISLNGEVKSNGSEISLKEATGEIGYLNEDLENEDDFITYFKLDKITLQGIIGEYTINGSINVTKYVKNQNFEDNNHFLPQEIIFEGSIETSNGSMKGKLTGYWKDADTFDIDEDKSPLLKITFNGTMKIPEQKDMKLVLEFESFENSNELTASYSYDNSEVIKIDASMDKDFENGTINITTDTQLEANMVIEDAKMIIEKSTMTKDGETVGSFEERNGVIVIKYTDGSFESLP